MWIPVDPYNPPAPHMVAIYNDGSGSQVLTKFDNNPNYMMAEDGWEIRPEDLAKDYSWWAPAPEGFVPRFMELTDDDHY